MLEAMGDFAENVGNARTWDVPRRTRDAPFPQYIPAKRRRRMNFHVVSAPPKLEFTSKVREVFHESCISPLLFPDSVISGAHLSDAIASDVKIAQGKVASTLAEGISPQIAVVR